MNINVFTAAILALATALSVFHSKVKDFYNPIQFYQAKVHHLNESVKREQLSHLGTSYEFQDFRNYVATLLPEKINELGPGEKSYVYRNLASVVQKSSNEQMSSIRTKSILEDGKSYFRKKSYEKAISKFESLVNEHPYSAFIPEALMLLVECNFIQNNYDHVINYANKMLDVFPDNELTGFALIRLGKVYEIKERISDASDIYKTVLLTFPNRKLASIARENLSSLEY